MIRGANPKKVELGWEAELRQSLRVQSYIAIVSDRVRLTLMPYEQKARTTFALPMLDQVATPRTGQTWFGLVDVIHPHRQSP